MIDKTNQRSTAEIADEYHGRRGWVPIPVPFKSKAPLIAGWQNRTRDDFSVDEFDNCNIGVLQGEPSNNLVDVDCDHELAVQFASDCLPPTDAVFGRKSKPRSHFLFRTTRPIETKQFRVSKANKAMIVEVRGTGGQTVFPGSVHPSGENIEWDSDGEPAEIEPDELLATVATLADVVRKAIGVEPPESERTEYHPAPEALPDSSSDVRDRAIAYLAKLPEAISGSGGHDALFTATMRLYRDFALEPDAVLAILQEYYNPRCQPPWSEKELRHKVDEAVKLGGPRGGLLIGVSHRDRTRDGISSNGPAENQRPSSADATKSARRMSADEAVATAAPSIVANAIKIGGDEPETIPIQLSMIARRIQGYSDNWPRSAGGILFVDHPESGSWMLEKQADLFAWLHQRFERVDWHRGASLAEKQELFAYLKHHVLRYRAIEQYPHFPNLDGHYYRSIEIKPGDGSALNWLVNRYCPETEIDRDLIKAGFVTPFWGGAPGARPGFAATSQHGRGVGKTKVITHIGMVSGGVVDFSLGEDIFTMKQRLLTPDAALKRVAMIDNVKTNRMSWAELEALVTASEISGKQMYHGERSRPNTLTWMMTLNSPQLCKDLAQRFVMFKLGKPERSATWEEETVRFIQERRLDVIADIAAFFAQSAVELPKCSRWASWEQEVLARLPEPEEAQRVIEERQGEVDADNEEAADVEEFFAKKLTELNYEPEHQRVHIPSLVARAWYAAATHTQVSVTGATRAINQAAEEGTLKRIRANPSRANGRGFLWIGASATGEALYDLDDRLRFSAADDALGRSRRWDD